MIPIKDSDPLPGATGTFTPMPPRPWLITFADLFCVLLAFFVLLFSMSSVQVGKWKNLTQAFSRHAESPLAGPARPMPPNERTKGGLAEQPALDLGYLGQVLQAHGKSNILLQHSVIYLAGEKLVISFPSDLIFASGSATINDKGAAALFDLAGLLRNIANDAEVVGHTDPTPVTGTYPSNWDLSLARAAAVADALKRDGYPREIPAFGAADSHFSQLPESIPWLQRLELARRVDLVLTPNEGGP
jgi:chemotaxis protein MotB